MDINFWYRIAMHGSFVFLLLAIIYVGISEQLHDWLDERKLQKENDQIVESQ